MANPQRPLFRERAMQYYLQRQQADVLPRFISPAIFLVCWFLLVLLLCALITFILVFHGLLKG